jgi:uncharacterized lipoprotein YmbA
MNVPSAKPVLCTIIVAGVSLLLAACSITREARFYTLSPMAQQPAQKAADEARKVSVNVSPVELPDYLNRLQIVTRDGSNELKLAEFDRWGGSLAENMTVVLAENLALLLDSEKVFAYPRVQSSAPDFTVAVRVLQLDCIPGDQVRLRAQWTVLTGAERTEAVTRISSISEKLDDRQYSTLVTAVSRTLGQLSSEVGSEINQRRRGP